MAFMLNEARPYNALNHPPSPKSGNDFVALLIHFYARKSKTIKQSSLFIMCSLGTCCTCVNNDLRAFLNHRANANSCLSYILLPRYLISVVGGH
jgi:hypothetical protein